jgi:hypothetical protein
MQVGCLMSRSSALRSRVSGLGRRVYGLEIWVEDVEYRVGGK